jgi:hypothetical protein
MAARSLILTDLLKNKSMTTKDFRRRPPEAYVVWIETFKRKIWVKNLLSRFFIGDEAHGPFCKGRYGQRRVNTYISRNCRSIGHIEPRVIKDLMR